jgi:hypothetical protein
LIVSILYNLKNPRMIPGFRLTIYERFRSPNRMFYVLNNHNPQCDF